MVEIVTETVIQRPPQEVADFAANPDNAPSWYVNIRAVEWKTPPPMRVGSRIAFFAHFLGRQWAYTYEIAEFVPGQQLMMRTSEGPFPMETTYTWEEVAGGQTRMSLRNRGYPVRASRSMTALMTHAMRKANRHDLARLKALLERGAGAAGSWRFGYAR